MKIFCKDNIQLSQEALIRDFTPAFGLKNNLWEFKTREHQLKRWLCNKKTILKISGIHK